MIVHRLQARNALKYAHVDLSDLPDKGVVLVTGPNESGKSTLGELLCLALFGRTHALPVERIERAVRWNSRTLELELEVSAPDGHRWSIRRSLDLDGSPSANLYCPATGADIHGWQPVTDAIVDLLGYDFDTFVESFYLARRDIGPPTPRAETLKAMAGVLPLERTADELEGRVPTLERRSMGMATEIEQVRTSLQAIARDDLLPPRPGAGEQELVGEVASRIEQLQDARERITQRLPALRGAVEQLVDLLDGAPLARWRSRVEALDNALDDVEAAMSWLGYDDTTSGTERLSGFLDKVQEGVESFGALVDKAEARRAWIGSMLGEAGAKPIDGSLGEDEDALDLRRQTTRGRMRLHDRLAVGALVIAASALAVGFLPIENLPEPVRLLGRAIGTTASLSAAAFAWSRSGLAHELRDMRLEDAELVRRREALEADARLLEGIRTRLMPDALDRLRELSGGTLARDLEAFDGGAGGRLVRPGLKEKLEAAVENRMGEVERHLAQLVQRIDADIEELSAIHELREAAALLVDDRRQTIEELATVELAAELARGAARHLTHEFNNDVRKGMVRVLPSLTEGRYQYLQIDDDMSVRVFSSEKQDFVRFEEISGGTQRQIELATRIALSEAVVTARTGGPQFLFLDEPFAFFDATRTRASMTALPHLSEALPQVWIAAQQAPEGCDPDRHLELTLTRTELVDPPGGGV